MQYCTKHEVLQSHQPTHLYLDIEFDRIYNQNLSGEACMKPLRKIVLAQLYLLVNDNDLFLVGLSMQEQLLALKQN